MTVNVIIETIDKLDKVQQWRQKSNSFIQALGQAITIINDAESLNKLFIQDVGGTSGLVFSVSSGRIRNKADITDILGANLTLPASQLSYVYLDVNDNTTKSSIVEPTEKAIPLYQVTTDSVGITLIEDKRSWATINTNIEQVNGFPVIEVFLLSSASDIITLNASTTTDCTVYVDGYRKVMSDDYIILNDTQIKFNSILPIGSKVIVAGNTPETTIKAFTSIDFKVATIPNQTDFVVTSVGQLTANTAVWVDGIRQSTYTLDYVNNKVILPFGVSVGTEVLIAKVEIAGGTFTVYDGNDGDIIYKVGSSLDVWDFGAPSFSSLAIISGVFNASRIPKANADFSQEWWWAYDNYEFMTPLSIDESKQPKKNTNWIEKSFAKTEDFTMTGFNGRSIVGDWLSFSPASTEVKATRYGRVTKTTDTSNFNGDNLKNAPFMIADVAMIRDPAAKFSEPKYIIAGEYGGKRLAVLDTLNASGNWIDVPTPFGNGWEIIGLGTYNYDRKWNLVAQRPDEWVFVSGWNKAANQSAIYKRNSNQFPSGGGSWSLVANFNSPTAINKLTKFSCPNAFYSSPLSFARENYVYCFYGHEGENLSSQPLGSVGKEPTALISFCSEQYDFAVSPYGHCRFHFFCADNQGNVYYYSTRDSLFTTTNSCAGAWTLLGNYGIGNVRHFALLFEPDGTWGRVLMMSGDAGTKFFRFEGEQTVWTPVDNVSPNIPMGTIVDSTLTYFHNQGSISGQTTKTILQDSNGDFVMHHYGSGAHSTLADATARFPTYYKAFTSENSPAPKFGIRSIVDGKNITMILADNPVNSIWVKGYGIDYIKPVSARNDRIGGLWFLNNRFILVHTNPQIVEISTDGISWTKYTATGLNNQKMDLVYGNGVYVAIYDGGVNRGQYSIDGYNYTNLPNVPDSYIKSITFDGSLFVGISTANNIVTSPNGSTWTVVGSTTISDIIYNPYYGGYIGVDGIDIKFSTDLITWVPKKGLYGQNLKLTGSGKHVFVNISYNNTTTNVLIADLNAPFNDGIIENIMPLNINDEPTEVFESGSKFFVGTKTINNITGRPPVYYQIEL